MTKNSKADSQQAETESKEVAAKPENAVSHDYGNHGQAGFEDVSFKDLSIPFYNVMQNNSPEIEEGEIPDLEPGDILNSVTKEIIKRPAVIIPFFQETNIMEWVPRHKGGGLVERYKSDYPPYWEAVKENNNSEIPPMGEEGKRIQFKSIDGNELIKTHYMVVLLMDETGTKERGFGTMAFSSTKIKIFQRLDDSYAHERS